MRALGIILVVVVGAIGFLWFLPMILNHQYFGLRYRSAQWYVYYTAACDSVLVKHPLGTNDSISISVADPSLPKIIADLHPVKIEVSPQRFWILLGSDSHSGFGLTWDPRWNETNIWNLHTTAESVDTVVYSARHGVPPPVHD